MNKHKEGQPCPLCKTCEECGNKVHEGKPSGHRGWCVSGWERPGGEKREHETGGTHCWCEPTIEVQPNGAKLIVHREFS